MTNSPAKMGSRLRELRLERGLQQGEVARRLAISPAYLSLMEKGKRAVQLPVLFRALELFDVSIEAFMASLGEQRAEAGLERLLDEPLLRSLNLSEEDLHGLSAEPKTVTTITALFNLYKATRIQLDSVMRGIAQRQQGNETQDGTLRFELSPFDEVIDFLEQHGNYFPTIEERADAFRAETGLPSRLSSRSLIEQLERHLDIEVRLVPEGDRNTVVRYWDPAARVLTLSAALYEQRLKFQLAHTIGLTLFDAERLHEGLAAKYTPRHEETRKLVKIHLANYFAGALLLPYGDFYDEVTRTRYDLEHLANHFESSYETVAHRLCNLSDPKRRGLPLHFLRVDAAGNVSKHYSATGVRVPQGSGSCPKSAVHMAFLTPNVITRQYEVYPDDATYFAFAKIVGEPLRGSLARGTVYSIGLGTHADNVKHLAYADDMPFADPQKMAVPVGVTCRFCERSECNQRAAASFKFAFRVDEYRKKDNFFSPMLRSDERADVSRAAQKPRPSGE